MNTKLDNTLCEKYPEIFRDRHAPSSETCMCWGFDCGDGWYPLIDALCAFLMVPVIRARKTYSDRLKTRARIDAGAHSADTEQIKALLNNYASDDAIQLAKAVLLKEESCIPIAIQVKEKFGGLRFYVKNVSPAQEEIILYTEDLSYRVCEMCGTMKDVTCESINNWIKTRCATCR